jgi:hypothetical protein
MRTERENRTHDEEQRVHPCIDVRSYNMESNANFVQWSMCR